MSEETTITTMGGHFIEPGMKVRLWGAYKPRWYVRLWRWITRKPYRGMDGKYTVVSTDSGKGSFVIRAVEY